MSIHNRWSGEQTSSPISKAHALKKEWIMYPDERQLTRTVLVKHGIPLICIACSDSGLVWETDDSRDMGPQPDDRGSFQRPCLECAKGQALYQAQCVQAEKDEAEFFAFLAAGGSREEWFR